MSDLLPRITYGGVVWRPTAPGSNEWYYHYGEAAVFPKAAYQALHATHAVMPVEPVDLVDTHEDEISDARNGHP